MKIYIDLIMILNFVLDFLLLISVVLILKRRVNIYRIIFGSAFGGLSILFLFFISKYILILKILISIIMILISFGFKDIKYFFINTLSLYLSSIVLGGFIYLLNIEFSYKKIGLIFINKGLSINFIIIILSSPILIYAYIKYTKALKYNYSNYYSVDIHINKKVYTYIGYMDTGNILVDNITKKPVILIDKRKILFDIKEFRIIPYMSSSGYSLLKVIKVNKIVIDNKEYKSILLGIIDNICIDGVDLILNRKLLEE